MEDRKKSFLHTLGQTNETPFFLDIQRAEGIYLYEKSGKKYMDMIAGVAVNNIGHRHPKVIQAIKKQLDSHLHVMVYGEFMQDAQLALSENLRRILPDTLNCVYAVNSGTEANEAALKLAKRATGRTELMAFRGAYHGSTHGALSVSGNEVKKQAYRPLLPDVRFLRFNESEDLKWITEHTAGVIIETVQGDAGVRIPDPTFLMHLKKRCSEVGALLIFDEIQCGMGRTGAHFAFEHFNVVPDILTLGKALGGGMPIGALASSTELLKCFTKDPALGHITTFGGHPVNCAAAAACLDVLANEINYVEVERLGKLLEETIGAHPAIIATRRIGMLFAFDMASAERVSKVVHACLERGLISFWFLSHPYSFRLSPPLNISEEEVVLAGKIILDAIEASE
jgi:acetylornithine/N-succinyldiaminopimelate aminotransferase